MSAEDLQSQLNEIVEAVDKAVVEGRTHEKADNNGNQVAEDDTPSPDSSSSSQAIDVKNLTNEQLVQYLQLQEYLRQKQRYDRFVGKAQLAPKEHKFWNTQPVLSLSEETTENKPINDTVTVDQVRAEAYNMPAGFSWCTIDVNDPAQIQEMYNLLNENYVEDDECMFRFDYSIPFLQWALTQPDYIPDWHVGVRNTKTGALMGCITAVPVHIRVYDQTRSMAEINFLCVHKKLRTKRLAPVLIKEITRRVNLTDRWQAVYTAGVVLPKPVSRCRYYHRSLNPKKLIEVRFSALPPKTTMANHLKNLKLPKNPTTVGMRLMTAEDVPAVHELLNNYLTKQAKLCQVWSVEDVRHNLVPRKDVVSTYVVEGADGKITDFCSFYYLPSTVIGNPLHNKLNAVYSYYNVANTISTEDLFRDLLIVARNEGADVFNALDAMENKKVFENLKFGPGDGWLQYYLYNWKCPSMDASEIGLILL